MADSLLLGNVIELMMGDTGPVFSLLPNLTNTTFALDDQNATYSLGAPQPTVDILASLITDGERPQGRRASNRTMSIPIAIISDTRDNLSLARETVFRIVDADQFTLRYTRDQSGTGPLILDCWRAEPATVTYEPIAEAQFACQITLNIEALPYGRSDTPNSINFLAPAAGTTPPPAAILMDNFNSLSAGQVSPWIQTPVSIDGNEAITLPPTNDLSVPSYYSTFATTVDLTTAGAGMNNVMHFWVGLASQRYYNNWANHKSEMAFAVYLTDVNGTEVSASVHKTVVQSNNLSTPQWVQISIRLPTSNTTFDFTQVQGYSIQAANYPHNGVSYVRWSQVFLDSFYAVSPSSSVTNVTRGSIYQLNGIEGMVHTPLSLIASQQPSTTPTVTTYTGTTGNIFQAPVGVSNLTATVIGPGGPASPSASTQNAGGGAELAQLSGIDVTAGNLYPIWAPPAGHTLGTANFAGTWTGCGAFATTNPLTTTGNQTFSAGVTAGNTVLMQIVLGSQPTGITASDSGGNPYVNIGSEAAPDGTFMVLMASFNIQTALTTSSTFDVNLGSSVTGAEIQVDFAQGFLSYLPNWSAQGTGKQPFAEDTGRILTQNFVTANADFAAGLAGWQVSGTGASAAVGTIGATTGIPNPNFVTLKSTSGASQPTLTGTALSSVLPSTTYMQEALTFLPTQTSMVVNLITNWYDSTHTFISATTVAITLTASTWQWNFTINGTLITSPSTAAYCTMAIQQNSATANNPLSVAALGLSLHSNETAAYIALTGNNSGLNAAVTPGGWTKISSALSSNLALDTFSIAMGHGAAGMIFGASGFYASAIPWGVVLVRLSNSAGYSYFRGDNNEAVLAHGGVGATNGTAGGGGTGSFAPLHSDGGTGALFSTSTPAGAGGGGSGGTGGAATWVEETNGSVTTWNSGAPPIQITGDWGPNPFGYYSDSTLKCFTVGGNVVTDANITDADMIVVAIVSTITGSSPAAGVTDSASNTYEFFDKAQIASNTWQVQIYTCRFDDNSSNHLGVLQPGDHLRVNPTSTPGNYAIMAWVVKETRSRYSTPTAEIKADFTSTTHTDTFTSLTGAPNVHFAFGAALDAVVATFGGNVAQSPVGNPQYPTLLTGPQGGSYTSFSPTTFPANSLMQAWWMEAGTHGTGTTTGVTFTRPISGELSYVGMSVQAGDGTNWNTSSNASYHGGHSKYGSKAGYHLLITWTGGQIQLMGKIGPDQGMALVSIDKGPWQTINNYAAGAAFQQVLFDTGKVANVAHTLELVTMGIGDPSSSNSYIDIDGYQIFTDGTGLSASGQTGGVAVTGGGAGANGGASGANGANGATPGGGGSGAGGTGHTPGLGGAGQVQLTYASALPAFKTLILHRPSIDGSKTLLPYVACVTQTVPTSDFINGIFPNLPPHFDGTYSVYVCAATMNSPSASRTWTVTVNGYESDPGGSLPSATESSSCARTFVPNTDPTVNNNLVCVGEITLPMKDIPPENLAAVYKVVANSTNSSDTIQDIIFLDTMGQTVVINEPTLSYPNYFIDEPTPDTDIGRILGSQFDRPNAISVLDNAYPSGGPLTVEPGDNILFAYCVEGAPALTASYFPRYYIDRTVS